MTWAEFLKSDLTLDEYARRTVEDALGNTLATMEANIEAAERRIAECEFERLVRESAMRGGVLPKAASYVAETAKELFDMLDGALVVRNGETMPGDPLAPLTFDAWLAEYRKQLPFLFES